MDPSCWIEALGAHVNCRPPYFSTDALARFGHPFIQDESTLMNWYPSTLNSMSAKVNLPSWWIKFSAAVNSDSIRVTPATRLFVVRRCMFCDMEAPWECNYASCMSIRCPWILTFVAAHFFGSTLCRCKRAQWFTRNTRGIFATALITLIIVSPAQLKVTMCACVADAPI